VLAPVELDEPPASSEPPGEPAVERCERADGSLPSVAPHGDEAAYDQTSDRDQHAESRVQNGAPFFADRLGELQLLIEATNSGSHSVVLTSTGFLLPDG
jgi:hypothetical protein